MAAWTRRSSQRRVGTGGSSGEQYLQDAVNRNYIFKRAGRRHHLPHRNAAIYWPHPIGDPDYNRLPPNVEHAGYANMYPINGAVVMIQTGNTATDAAATAVAASAFPGSRHHQIPLPNLDHGGGGVHCVTQQDPVA